MSGRIALVLSILSLVMALTGSALAWTGFPDGVFVQRTGPQFISQLANDPCPSFMIRSGVLQFGDGQYGPSGTCDDSLDLTVGRYGDASGEVGLEVSRNSSRAGVVGISIRSNDAPTHTIGAKVIDGDLWITDNDQGAQYSLGKVKQDGSYEFANGCRIYPNAALLQSSCIVSQPETLPGRLIIAR